MNNSQVKHGYRKYIGESALLLVTLIWGGTFTIIKVSLDNISTMLFVGIRFFIATLILLPFVFSKLKLLKSIQIKKGIILSVLLFIGFATQTIGLKYTTASKSGFITGSLVLFTPIFQIIIEKKKPSKSALAGAFLVLCGLLFLSVKETSLANFFSDLGSNFNLGDFLTLLGAVAYALYIVYLDMFSREIDTSSLVFLQVSSTTILAFLFSIFLSSFGIESYKLNLSGNLVLSLLYTSLLATVVTTYLQTKYQKEITPTNAGIIFSFEPVFAALIAIIFINEVVSGFGIVGCILIFLGLLVSELFNSRTN